MTKAAAGYDLLREKLRANKIARALPAGKMVLNEITNCYLTFSPYSTTRGIHKNSLFQGKCLKQ